MNRLFSSTLSTGIILLVTVHAPAALAERWIPVSTGDEDVRHFIDLDSIRRRDNFVDFWVETIGYSEEGLPQFQTRSLIAADCVQKVWRFQEQYKAQDGEMITIHQEGEEGPINILTPNNPRYAVLDYICNGPTLDAKLEVNMEADPPSERLMAAEPNYSCSDFGNAERANAALNLRAASSDALPPNQPDRGCTAIIEW